MASVSPARQVAFAILEKLEGGHAHADDLLRGRRVADLIPSDRNLATALVLGVLRWQIWLDGQIRAFLERPGARLDSPVRTALRLGAYQLLAMTRIPQHAAIGESVELAKRSGHHYAARMVNAVLRKVGASREEPGTGAWTQPSAVAAYPLWMVERWSRSFGPEATEQLCCYGQLPAPAAVRMEDPETELELLAAGIGLGPGTLLVAARRVTSGDLSGTEALRSGRVCFQDEGSQLVAEIAGHGDLILDCCAAPGGKTLILAARNPSARIVACELSPQRLGLLAKRLEQLGDRVQCRIEDAAALREENVYDLVLVDAPCSGTGTLGRNPEIRHRLRPEDLPRQAKRQKAILNAALRAAKPGGKVVYSTCSLEPEENEEVVAAVAAPGRARMVPVSARIAELRALDVLMHEARLERSVTTEGFLRLLPGAAGTDGFFIAVLEKSGSD